MSEMEHTASHLIVIGRGRLIADTSLDEFTRSASASWVQVRSPQPGHLARLLRDQGATAGPGPGGSLAVRGATAAEVGDLAARHGIALHELFTRQASLEQAFMELTRDAADYRPRLAGMARRS
jgi:ABC-2 type transport system ATP-binding protein